MSQTLNTLLNLDPKQEVIDPVTGLPQSEARQEELKEDLSQPLSLYDLEPEMFGSDPYGVTRTDYVDKQLWEDAVEGAEKVYGHQAGNYNRASGSAEQPYGRHGTLGLHVGDDYEDFAAAGQNNVNKWGNGLAKLGGKTLTNAIGGISMLGTGIYALTQGDMSKTFDNDFMNTLDDVNEWMDYKLPNYANKEYRDMGFFNKMLTANFWAGDFFGQVVPFVTGAILSEVALTAASAYTIGAAAPGQVAATAGIVARGTNILNKLFKTGNAIRIPLKVHKRLMH